MVADGYLSEHWDSSDGLPVNEINAVVQSADGYIWLATFDGLVRFDGHRFTVFDSSNSPALPSNRLISLIEGPDGGLWAKTEQGYLVRFHQGRFENILPFDDVRSGDVNTLLMDHETLWIGTDRGLFRFFQSKLEPVFESEIKAEVLSLAAGRYDDLWIGTRDQGLYHLVDEKIERFTEEDGLPCRQIYSLSVSEDDVLWFGCDNGLYRLQGDHFIPVTGSGIGEHPALSIEAEVGETVWVNTYRELYKVESGIAESFGEDYLGMIQEGLTVARDPFGVLWQIHGSALYREQQKVFDIAPWHVDCHLADHEGNIWLGTTAGLFRLRATPITTIGRAEGLPDENIYPILEDSAQRIWVGTQIAGLAVLDSGQIRHIDTRQGLPADIVMSIEEDSGGTIWVGGTGICRIEAFSDRCVTEGIDPRLHEIHVRAIHEDQRGQIWIGSWNGLFLFDRTQWRQIPFSDGLPRSPVRVIHETADGTLWVGTNGGGVVGFEDDRIFETLTTDDGLSSDLVRSLHEDEDGVLWVGTETHGLDRVEFTDAGPEITNYRKRDGLFDNVVHQIIDDGRGRYWMSGNRGIFWVSKIELNSFARGEITSVHSNGFTERNGMRNREANGGVQGAGIMASDGRLYFPTQAGVVIIDPDELSQSNLAPPVVVEEVVSRGRMLERVANSVEIAPNERNFEIAYTALSFIDPEHMSFRYRLAGFDDEWVNAGSRRHAIFTRVPPGHYRFEVIAANSDGIWNEEGAFLNVRVLPIFYETRIFAGALLAVVAVLLVGGIRWRTGLLRAHERELEAEVAARTRDLRQEKEALRKSQESLSMSHNIALVGSWKLNLGTLIITLSPEYQLLMGAPPKELAMPLEEFINKHHIAEDLSVFQKSLEFYTQGIAVGEYSDQFEIRGTDVNGEQRDHLVWVRFVGKGILGGVSQDITARKQAENDLRAAKKAADEASQAKTTFLAGMSHELRTPLNAMLGYTQILERDESLMKEHGAAITTIFESGEHLLAMINDILDISKIEAGKMEVAPAPFDLGKLLDSIAKMVRGRIEGKGISFTYEESTLDSAKFVLGHDTYLRQVLLNLLNNATKFTEKGQIILDVGCSGNQIRFSVRDTGIGIANDKLGTIFEPFYQAADRSLQIQGTGLGLAISHKLVRLMGGELHVTSETNQGSNFWFELTLPQTAELTADASSQPAHPIGFEGDAVKILIVDDNLINMKILEAMLSPLGFELAKASDGRQAVTTAETFNPDLILLDLVMPDIDGFEAAQLIRRLPRLNDVIIIIVSADSFETTRQKSLEVGCDDYLPKPVRRNKLLSIIREHLDLEWVYEDQ